MCVGLVGVGGEERDCGFLGGEGESFPLNPLRNLGEGHSLSVVVGVGVGVSEVVGVGTRQVVGVRVVVYIVVKRKGDMREPCGTPILMCLCWEVVLL